MNKSELNRLSEVMYSILYKNNKPNYNLSTEDFMQLLFIQDSLSKEPIIKE